MRTLSLSAALAAVGLVACDGGGDVGGRAADGRPLVLTTTWPLADLVTRLAPDAVAVGCIVPPGRDVRSWSPSREDLVALGDAALVVLNGAGLETWLRRANLPRARVVDTTAGFADRLIEVESEAAHSHGDGEMHTHTGTDPHVWLDPELFALQARAVAEALARIVPASSPAIEAHLAALLSEAARLAASVRTLPPLDAGEVLVASHPTWAYLARRADLPVVDVDLDPRAVDVAAVVAKLRDALGERRAVAVLWEREPGQQLRDAVLDGVGARSVVFDPQVVRAAAGSGPATLAALEAGISELRAALATD